MSGCGVAVTGKLTKAFSVCWIVVAIVCLAGQSHGGATPFSAELHKALVNQVGARDAVMISSADGKVLAQINADLPLIPASVLKILTALTALETLGETYRFQTDFLEDSSGNLKIKGYGDPLLVSERLHTISQVLAAKRQRFNDLILDDSYFRQPLKIPGRSASTQPYDAPNGALCVNFNTVAFKHLSGRWVSAEPQTPLLSSVIPKIKATGLASGRITLAANSEEALHYTGQLFQHFLTQVGIQLSGRISRGRVSYEADTMLWRYRSQDDLGQAIRALLEFSNNFMANQILLVMGAQTFGPPATIEKGLSVLEAYYRQTLGISTGRIVEASGISRHNRLTARAMIIILDRFDRYHTLLRHQNGQYYKTGHLKGIRTRAGFITGRNQTRYRFAVILNTPGKTTHRIMQTIARILDTTPKQKMVPKRHSP